MRQQGLDFFVNQEDYEEWAAGRGLKTARNQDELIEVLEEIDGKYVNKRYSGHKVSLWDKPAEQFKDFYLRCSPMSGRPIRRSGFRNLTLACINRKT